MSVHEESSELSPALLRAVRELWEGRSIESNVGLVVDTFRPQLCNYFRRRGFEEAEDLTQEVFLEVIQGIGRLEDPAEFRSWFFAIAANHCREAYRDRARRAQRIADLVSRCLHGENADDVWVFGGRSQESPDAQLLLEERYELQLQDLRVLWSVVTEISPQMRRCLVYRLRGKPLSEIAKSLGITTGAVKNHISRAVQRLREAIAACRSQEVSSEGGPR